MQANHKGENDDEEASQESEAESTASNQLNRGRSNCLNCWNLLALGKQSGSQLKGCLLQQTQRF
jgi:hypothetical protein